MCNGGGYAWKSGYGRGGEFPEQVDPFVAGGCPPIVMRMLPAGIPDGMFGGGPG